MRRSTILGAASVAALAAGSLAVSAGSGSSHREAPSILADPTADNTDLYAFTAPDAPNHLTIVSNWIPFEDPSGGPYFGKLDPKAHYYVKIDNTGDGREDVAYRWQFSQRFRNPNSFLYAAPTVDSVDDPDINFVQTYDLYRETYNKQGELKRSLRIANDLPVAPDNVGPKTIPDYGKVAAGAVKAIPNGGKSFVGPADDPFFIDLAVGVRRHQHRQAGPSRHRPGQPGRRQGRRRGLQHARVRAAGAEVRRDAQRPRRVRPGRRQRRRGRLGDHGAQADLRRAPPRQAPRAGPTGCRSAASATR